MLESRNRLLARLEREDRGRLLSGARPATLRFGEVVFHPDQAADQVLFLESGVISIITESGDGEAAEGGLIGAEGAAGLVEALGSGCIRARGTVQARGQAWIVPAQQCRALHAESPTFRMLAARAAEFQLVETRQSLLCRSYHLVEQRLCRWLLEMADRSEAPGGAMSMTQEILGLMLAVQRTTVSGAAAQLKARGLIDYSRGHIRLLDRAALEQLACPCRHSLREAKAHILRCEAAPERRTVASI